ncbi:MAG TPA: DHA2 family efflux MFS transporter permease subunit [Kofleriaceae bacterium]|jgi:DHA2 family multidrug resistance protein
MTEDTAGRPAYFETGWTGGRNPWAIALVVTMATFMEILDSSIANVSLPHIAGTLSVTQDESTWILTSYLISNAVVLPISGWLATKVGRKRFYMSCVAIFIASSFFCGIAPNLGSLIFFRVLQGIGGGGLAPSEQAILVDTFPKAKRGMAMAVYGMAAVVAPAIGPTIGGYITDHYSWRWVFFINVPIGLVSLALTSRMVTDPPHLARMRERSGGIDYLGVGLIALALGCLEFVLDKGQEDDWFQSGRILLFAIVSVIAIAAFIAWELKQEHPVIDIRMFTRGTFASVVLIMLGVGMVLYGPTVLFPQFEQVMMGYTAQQAGESMTPGGFVIILLLPLVGWLTGKVSTRLLVGIGFGVMAWSLLYMSRHLYIGVDFKTVTIARTLQMAGFAFLFVPINTLAYAGVPPEQNNAVSGIMNLARNLGGSIGISMFTTVAARHAQIHQRELARYTNDYSTVFVAHVHAIARGLEHAGFSSIAAAHKALAVAYGELQQQAAQLAYLDVLRLFVVVALCMFPLLLLVRSPPPGAQPVAAH